MIWGKGQEKYIAIAEDGLILRDSPNSSGNRIGKLFFGAEATIIQKTNNQQTIMDNGKEITGNWVKITFENFPDFISQEESGYVFDGFLKKKSDVIKEMKRHMAKFPELKNYTVAEKMIPFYLNGDFFGDKVQDVAIMVKDKKGKTKIAIIDYGKKNKLHFIGNNKDSFGDDDYSWVGVFNKVNKGEVLWSNYEDDFVDFKNVPEHKKVRLNYDAMFVHASESCGGGFIYWKNGKFNWLQQE